MHKYRRKAQYHETDKMGVVHHSNYMDGTHPSCRSLNRPYAGADKNNFQYYLIDGFIVSGNLEIPRFETLDEDFVNTDHNPVCLRAVLK